MATDGAPTPQLGTWDDRITIAWLLLAAWLPLLAAVVGSNDAISRMENRALAAFPSPEPGRLAQYPRALEAYFDDHMGFRVTLIRWNAYANVAWLGVSPAEKLVVGKDGWFFFGHDAAIAQYRGLARFEEAELEVWRETLEARRDWLAEQDVAYLLVLAPNKHAVYPEFMPDRYPRVGDEEQHQQLARHLATHSDLVVVDLLPVLREARREQRVYHKTDTHWNDVGAYAAYRAILGGLARVLPDRGDWRPVDVRFARRWDRGMGLTSLVGLSGVYLEERLELTKLQPRARVAPAMRDDYREREQRLLPLLFQVADPELPTAIVFRDSFANALIPYLSEHFRRTVYMWSRDIDPRAVRIEHPDVVVQEIVGRFLGHRPLSIPELDAQLGR